MSDEQAPQTSKIGVALVAVVVVGSAIGAVVWHLQSSRGEGLDTSGFDMSSGPAPVEQRPASAVAPAPAPPAPTSGLGMTRAEEDMTIVGTRKPPPSAAPSASGAVPNPTDPKEAAVLNMKEAAIRNESFVTSFVRRMEAKHPSITQYGKDWAASPELSALRDAYWKDRDPLKFAYGLAKSNDFGKLVKKYANDPGVRDVITSGIKEAPAGLTGAIGGLAQNDGVVKDLVLKVITGAGLPASLFGAFVGGDAPPDPNQTVKDIMNSDQVKKAIPVSAGR